MSGLPTTHESSWRQSFQSTLALASMGMKKPRFYIAATVGALLLLLLYVAARPGPSPASAASSH